ncbi:MAG TPA: glutamine amidotransferase [Acidimicrobiales bacterium]|nr:glutamine amidotransferase [Acidimicrobiales bacterium]
MCGIAGRILDRPGPVGADLVELMQAQEHRGADSTGFALYGEPRAEGFVVKVFLSDRGHLDRSLVELHDLITDHGGELTADPTWDDTGQSHVFIRLEISEPVSPVARWVDAADELEGVEIQSVGRSLEIIEDVGDATEVAAKHHVGEFIGTHGVGHARLATESTVLPTASHPFWARPFPDVAIVHNGQLTNYYLQRRRLERAGYRFTTENDSEMIAVWLSDQMSSGSDLARALATSVKTLDGVFTYLLSTADAIGMAKDRLAIKPIVAIEDGIVTAMATEEQALRHLYPEEGETVNYDGPGLTRVWPATTPATVAT